MKNDSPIPIVVLIAAVIGALAHLARALTGARDTWTWLQLAGGVLGSAIASFSAGALMLDRGTSELFVIGLAGPVGWLGGSFLATVAALIEAKLGQKE